MRLNRKIYEGTASCASCVLCAVSPGDEESGAHYECRADLPRIQKSDVAAWPTVLPDHWCVNYTDAGPRELARRGQIVHREAE